MSTTRSDSLYNLTRYLYNHFNNAKVYILVDEFDSVNANALRGIRGNNMKDTVWKLEDICSTLAGMLSNVTKTSDPWIGGALITGVLCVMAPLGYSHPLNNFTKMKFLEGDNILPSDQDFVPFYGATKNEVMGLIQKLVKDKCLVKFEQKEEFLNSAHELDVDKIMVDVQSHYDGYFDREGTRIFCLWSVLQYLETADPRNYWNQTDGVENLHHIFKCETIAYETMNLIRGEEIMFTRHNIIRVEDFVKLHDLMQNASENKVTPGMVFNFLIDLGYLSYPEGGSQGRKFKLPNAEIRTALSLMIGDIVQNFWKIATISCTRLIEDISLSTVKDEKLLQSMMLDVHKTICETLGQLKENKPTYMNEARMLCIMNTILNDVKSFELTVDLPIRDAEGRSITSDRSDFLLLHKHDQKFSMLWELKCKEDGTKDEYTTSLHALQEARGIAATRNGKTKNYMDLLKKLGREALVVGLSVDNDNKVSLSYSSGMEEKIFSISEREHILYPDFYKTYSPVLLLKKESSD